MKKLIVCIATLALAISVFSMAKAPADADCGGKTCPVIKDASCCTTDGSCKSKEACGLKAEAQKEVEKASGCAGGTCPLPK